MRLKYQYFFENTLDRISFPEGLAEDMPKAPPLV
jgi:hypothetical protein